MASMTRKPHDWRHLVTVSILSGRLLSVPSSAVVQPAEDFFSGKQIKLIISTGPGGGYDTNARLVARFYGAHIPGNPAIVPQNMPGAGAFAPRPSFIRARLRMAPPSASSTAVT